MSRPTEAELEAARDIIRRAKAADNSIRRADELLVCAAIACRAGECGGVPTACAALMQKATSRSSQVTAWMQRIEVLEEMRADVGEPEERDHAEESDPALWESDDAGEEHAAEPSSAVDSVEAEQSMPPREKRPLVQPARAVDTPGGTRQRVTLASAPTPGGSTCEVAYMRSRTPAEDEGAEQRAARLALDRQRLKRCRDELEREVNAKLELGGLPRVVERREERIARIREEVEALEEAIWELDPEADEAAMRQEEEEGEALTKQFCEAHNAKADAEFALAQEEFGEEMASEETATADERWERRSAGLAKWRAAEEARELELWQALEDLTREQAFSLYEPASIRVAGPLARMLHSTDIEIAYSHYLHGHGPPLEPIRTLAERLESRFPGTLWQPVHRYARSLAWARPHMFGIGYCLADYPYKSTECKAAVLGLGCTLGGGHWGNDWSHTPRLFPPERRPPRCDWNRRDPKSFWEAFWRTPPKHRRRFMNFDVNRKWDRRQKHIRQLSIEHWCSSRPMCARCSWLATPAYYPC